MCTSITGLSHAKYFASVYGPKLREFATTITSLHDPTFCVSTTQQESLSELFNVLSDFSSQDPSLRSFITFPSSLSHDLLKCLLCHYRLHETSVSIIDVPYFALMAEHAIDISITEMLMSHCSCLQQISSAEGRAFVQRYLCTLLHAVEAQSNKRKELLVPCLHLHASHSDVVESLFRQCLFPDDSGFLEDICSQALPPVDGSAAPRSSKGSFHHELFTSLRNALESDIPTYKCSLKALVKSFGAASKSCVGDSSNNSANAQHAFAASHRSHIRRLLHFSLTLLYACNSTNYRYAIRCQLQQQLSVEGALPTHASLAPYLAQLHHQTDQLIVQVSREPVAEDVLSLALLLDIDHRVVTEQLPVVMATLSRISDWKCSDAVVALVTELILVFNSMRRLDYFVQQLLQLHDATEVFIGALKHKGIQHSLYTSFAAMTTPLWLSCLHEIVAGASAKAIASCVCIPVASAYRATIDTDFMMSLFPTLQSFLVAINNFGISIDTLEMLEAVTIVLSRHYAAYQYTSAFSQTSVLASDDNSSASANDVDVLWSKLLLFLDDILFSKEFVAILQRSNSSVTLISLLRVLFNSLELSVERADNSKLFHAVAGCVSAITEMGKCNNTEVAVFLFEHVLYWAELPIPLAHMVQQCVESILTLPSAASLLINVTVRENRCVMNEVCSSLRCYLPAESACLCLMNCPSAVWIQNNMVTSVLKQCLEFISHNSTAEVCQLMNHAIIMQINASTNKEEAKVELASILSDCQRLALTDMLPCNKIGDVLTAVFIDITLHVNELPLQERLINVLFGTQHTEYSGIARLLKFTMESQRTCAFNSFVNTISDSQQEWNISTVDIASIQRILSEFKSEDGENLQSVLRLISILRIPASPTLMQAISQGLFGTFTHWWQLCGIAVSVLGLGEERIPVAPLVAVLVKRLYDVCIADEVGFAISHFCRSGSGEAVAHLISALDKLSMDSNILLCENVLLVCESLLVQAPKNTAIIPEVMRIVSDIVLSANANARVVYGRALKLLAQLLTRDSTKKRKRGDDTGHEDIIIRTGVAILTAVGGYAQHATCEELLTDPIILKSALQLLCSMISTSTGEHATLVVSLVSMLLRQWLALLLRLANNVPSQLSEAYSSCCSVYGRILLAFCSNNNYRKHSPVLTALILEVIVAAGGSSTYLSADFKNHIMPGVYGLFDTLFLIKQRKEVTLILPPFCRPLFNELYSTYEQDFKFIGKS